MKYGEIPSGHVIIPWLSDPEFLKTYSEMSQRTCLHTVKCYMLYQLAKHMSEVSGYAAECGVYKGGSAYVIASALRGSRTFFLFDTFSGIPPGDPSKDNRYINGGEFSETSLEEVQKFLAPFDQVICKKGLIPDTLFELNRGFPYGAYPFAFVHIDLDIYFPILASLQFFYPRMSPGGVIILDDYGSEECRGAYLAVEEFCASVRRNPVVLPTGQALLIKGRD